MNHFIETRKPDSMRQAVLELQQEIVRDPYFQEFPSIEKTDVAFHAKDDVPEIRYRFFKHLASLDFQAQFVVARKIERVFRNSFQAKEDAFYDHLIIHLLELSTHG